MVGEFYTYMLVDPRSNVPFYIGKGRGRRCMAHICEARTTNKNTAKLNKIRKIESLGLQVVVRKVEEGVTDALAQEFEQLLISECRDKGIPLTNQTDGGDGSAGYKHRPESREKISKSQRGKPKPESQKQKLREFLKQNPIHDRPGVKEKVSGANHWNFGKPSANKGVKWPDEQRRRLSERFAGKNHPHCGKPCSEERRAAIKAATTGVKKSTTVNMCKPKRKEQCPHCGKWMSGGNLARWHGDKCKEKNNDCA